MEKAKEIIKVDIAALVEFKGNPRQISAEELTRLKKSIETYGMVLPVVIDENNTVIGGHQRLRAMKEMGQAGEIDAVRITGYTESEKKSLNIALNKISGDWDSELLQEMLDSLAEEEYDIELTGFSEKELRAEGVDIWAGDKDEKEDDVPEEKENETVYIQKGDVIELGAHRLMCGDSANEFHLERLMNGKRFDMVFTDPPYGVDYGEKNRFLNTFQKGERNPRDIAGDMLDSDELYGILVKAFTNANKYSEDYCSYYVTAPQGGEMGTIMLLMMAASELPVRHILIWNKNSQNFSMGHLDYEYKHEPILYTWKKNHTFYGGGKYKNSVWDIAKERKCDMHPTMKPVELIENAILNSSQPGQIVGDIFLGSGSTIIACEKTGRVCHGMELEAHYCQVIIERYLAYTETEKVVLNGMEYNWQEFKDGGGKRRELI